jgi:hypothetical protein
VRFWDHGRVSSPGYLVAGVDVNEASQTTSCSKSFHPLFRPFIWAHGLSNETNPIKALRDVTFGWSNKRAAAEEGRDGKLISFNTMAERLRKA